MATHLLVLSLFILPCFASIQNYPPPFNTKLHRHLDQAHNGYTNGHHHKGHHEGHHRDLVKMARVRTVLRRLFVKENRKNSVAGKFSFKTNRKQFHVLVQNSYKGNIQETQQSERMAQNYKVLNMARNMLARAWLDRIQ